MSWVSGFPSIVCFTSFFGYSYIRWVSPVQVAFLAASAVFTALCLHLGCCISELHSVSELGSYTPTGWLRFHFGCVGGFHWYVRPSLRSFFVPRHSAQFVPTALIGLHPFFSHACGLRVGSSGPTFSSSLPRSFGLIL